MRGSDGDSANSFCELRAEDLMFIRFVFCVLNFALKLRRLFRCMRPLVAVGVLAPDEALCREVGVKQSGITIILSSLHFPSVENVGFLFFRLPYGAKLCCVSLVFDFAVGF